MHSLCEKIEATLVDHQHQDQHSSVAVQLLTGEVAELTARLAESQNEADRYKSELTIFRNVRLLFYPFIIL